MAGGGLLGAAGLLGFAAATSAWQVLAVWWLVLGPATALTFYEPAYVALQQAFAPEVRPRAVATLTLTAGLSGPVFTPAVGALVDALGWRDATRVLAAAMALVVPVALLFLIPARPRPASAPARAPRGRPGRPDLRPFLRPRLLLFTAGAVLGYGAVEAVVVHRVARFEELDFSLATVTSWAGVSGLLTLPGRFLLPALARRVPAVAVLAAVFAVLAAATALMTAGSAYWQMAASFILFGLVFGAAMPLRAIVMGAWVPTAAFGEVMGVQAALIAVGRAGLPALAGGLHDLLGGYTVAVAVLAALLAVAALLVLRSATG